MGFASQTQFERYRAGAANTQLGTLSHAATEFIQGVKDTLRGTGYEALSWQGVKGIEELLSTGAIDKDSDIGKKILDLQAKYTGVKQNFEDWSKATGFYGEGGKGEYASGIKWAELAAENSVGAMEKYLGDVYGKDHFKHFGSEVFTGGEFIGPDGTSVKVGGAMDNVY